jgi:hypothetical protein
VDGDLGEYMDFETADKQAARLTSFGRVPLLILSADPNARHKGMSANAIAEKPIWDREQESLKSLSRLSWRVIARGSGHKIYQDRPDVVLGEMIDLIEYLHVDRRRCLEAPQLSSWRANMPMSVSTGESSGSEWVVDTRNSSASESP